MGEAGLPERSVSKSLILSPGKEKGVQTDRRETAGPKELYIRRTLWGVRLGTRTPAARDTEAGCQWAEAGQAGGSSLPSLGWREKVGAVWTGPRVVKSRRQRPG